MNKSQVQKIIKNQLFFGVNEIRTNNANIDKKIYGKKTNSSKTLFAQNNIDIQNDLFVHGNVDISGLLDISGLIVQNNASIHHLLDTSGLSVSNNASVSDLLDTSGLSVSNNASVSDLLDTSGLSVSNNASVGGLLDTSGLNIHNTIILDTNYYNSTDNISSPYNPLYVLDALSGGITITFDDVPDYNGQIMFVSCISDGNTINIAYIDATTSSMLAIPISTTSSYNYKFIGVKIGSIDGWIVS